MASFIEELATQMLEQTRVVTNAPLPGANEPLRVDVVPGGGSGLVVADLLNGVSGLTEALRLTVTYEVQRDGVTLTEGDHYVRLPTITEQTGEFGTLSELLSVAFLLAPRVKLVNRPATGQPLPVVVPELDHKLIVTISITATASALDPLPMRKVEIPFTVPTIELGVPLPTALAILSANANLDVTTGDSLVMLGPGSPETVMQAVDTYNQLMSTLDTLETVLNVAAVLIKPLQLVVDTLAKLPETADVTTETWVLDLDAFGTGDGFDDEVRSLIVVAPTGWALEISDTANPGDWDDLGSHCLKSYTAVDLLQLPTHAHGTYLLDRLDMTQGDVEAVRDALVTLTGDDLANVRLGIGVIYVDDLTSAGTAPTDLRKFDNCDKFLREKPDEWGDTGSARWKVA